MTDYERASLLRKAQEAVDRVHRDDKEKISDGYHTFRELYEKIKLNSYDNKDRST